MYMDYINSVVQFIVYLTLYLPIKYLFKPKITFQFNQNNLKKGVIFACNHQSRLDLFLLFGAIPPSKFINLIPIRGLVAEKYMDTWWKKILLGGFGTHPLKKGIKESSGALLFILDLIDKRHTILLFPEGKVLKKNEMIKANPGLGYLALKRNIKIVPTYLSGFRNVKMENLIKGKYRPKIAFGKPQSFFKQNLSPETVSETILSRVYALSSQV